MQPLSLNIMDFRRRLRAAWNYHILEEGFTLRGRIPWDIMKKNLIVWECDGMELKDFRTLLEIERLGSISLAARTLYVSQPGLSQFL